MAEVVLYRKQKTKDREEMKDMDARSDSEASTVATSTASRGSPAVQYVLTQEEEKEARKYEKTLREIARLEDLLAQGAKLDPLQHQKLQRRPEVEGTLVMIKVRAGFARFGS